MSKGYGYRMYLDDLPSATVIDGKTYYDTHVPLGFIRWTERPDSEKKETTFSLFGGIPVNLKPKTFIYNHLDIEVTIHETGAT